MLDPQMRVKGEFRLLFGWCVHITTDQDAFAFYVQVSVRYV